MAKKGAKAPSPKKQEQPIQQSKQQQKFSLYNLLELQNGEKSTTDQIKKQYRKLVVKYHPDKNQGDETARQKFQKIKQAYDILMDPEKRKIYDETGSIGQDFNQNAFQAAYQYYRQIYKKIEKEDIDEFSKRYRYGEMEEEDLIDFYQSHEGNMITLLECIPLSCNQDIQRFITFFEQKIEEKQLKKYKNFEKTKKKVRKLVDETEEFEQQEKQQKNKMDSLVLAIRNKSSNTNFLDALEKKYSQPVKKKVQKSAKTIQKKVHKPKK